MSPERVANTSRKIEDAGLIVGLAIMSLYGLAELVIYVVVSLGMRPYVSVPMPKVIVLLSLLCVLPKYLGRSTAGQIWIALVEGVTRQKVTPPTDPKP